MLVTITTNGTICRGDGDEESEPDWVKAEREAFADHRDENGDGFMDLDEVRKWILPAGTHWHSIRFPVFLCLQYRPCLSDYDHTEAEAKHLIYESDTDGDSKLSKEEILANYDLFVGSQATDFGEALTRHDEF